MHKTYKFYQFCYVFYTGKCIFYLDNILGSRWVKANEDIIIYSKNKETKIGVWEEVPYHGKTSLFLYENNLSSVYYIKILKRIREIKFK